MTTEELFIKAERAIASAHILFTSGDWDGASNRAYYAMFDAARAALMALAPTAEAETIRTHNGLITAFSLHLVKTNKVPIEQGRNLNRVEEIRLIADYKGDAVEQEQAQWAIQQAEAFLSIIQNLIRS